MPAQIDLSYAGKLRCAARFISTGHTIHTDVSTASGGLGEAFSPTDLVAVALGSCVISTLALVAERHHIDLAGMSACIEKDTIAVPVRRISMIGMAITMPLGLNLTPEDRQRLENAAKKCPVKNSLHPDIDLRIEFVYPA